MVGILIAGIIYYKQTRMDKNVVNALKYNLYNDSDLISMWNLYINAYNRNDKNLMKSIGKDIKEYDLDKKLKELNNDELKQFLLKNNITADISDKDIIENIKNALYFGNLNTSDKALEYIKKIYKDVHGKNINGNYYEIFNLV